MMARVTAPTRWPEARATRGMVAAPHALAAEAGRAIFTAGGNALDAAIAAAATIAVVYPHMNSVGGDNFWLIYDARARRLRALNACGRSAARIDADDYRTRYGDSMPIRGGSAAMMAPGVVSGWWEAHRMSRDGLGSPISWTQLVEAAVHYARDGFAVSPGQRRVTAGASALFAAGAPAEVRRSFWPVYHPDRFADGRFVQTDLATTLAAIAEGGSEEFYRGDLARRIVAGASAVGSPLTLSDLSEHRADWVEPLRVRYRGGEATSFPPPTQGFAALAILALLDGFDVAGLDDADYVHVIVEATKLAFEDRDRYLADPAVVPVPVDHCLDAARLVRRRDLISRRAAMVAGGSSGDGDTIAIVAADADGNAVSVIQSTYHEFGAAVVAGDTGLLLQNRGAFFSLDPRHPNALAPRKRTAHTLIPSIYMVGGRPRLVYGTMGGEGQPQTQAALVTRLVDRWLGPQAAVEAPRWLYGRTWGEPSKALRIEQRFGDDVATSLGERGHDVRVVEAWSDLMGHAQCIALDDGILLGGSDPRADGAALGV
ncbi:MAG: gamma-glutamyltransferase [Candidatus Rokuibacteriota bacterium]|nr:MAG: gamma-glutamyltransferase [Candidatus Rokubacteria bacterium]